MKRVLVLVALSLFLCSTTSAFQGGGGESSKKKVVTKKKTSGAKSANTAPARRPASPPTRTPAPATTKAQAAERERQYEALRTVRIAERTRVEQGIAGQWSGAFGSHPDAQLTITKDGTAISGVLLTQGVRETLRGELLADNRLMLTPISVTRESGTGNYSPDTILIELGPDGVSLKGSYRDTSNHAGSVAMTRRSVQPGSETKASPAVSWTSVSAGSSYACALTTTGAPFCWGNGHGDITTNDVSGSPGLVDVIGETNIAMVSASNYSTCWLTTSGAAYCDGLIGHINDRTAPEPVRGGLRFSLVSVGKDHACGLSTTGEAYCWGSNFELQLGSTTVASRYGGAGPNESAAPVPVQGGLRFVTLSAGEAHTCAITAGGAAYCWGAGYSGQLGNGATESSAKPVAVSGGLSFASVTASAASLGNSFTCGLTTSGAAYCWGVGDGYQLGNGQTQRSSVPVAVAGGLTFTALSAEAEHVCGVTTSGAAYCWGTGGWGNLGTGATKDALTPVPVAGALKFASISSGWTHTCGVTTGGALYCWGTNSYGELGGATKAERSLVPVAIQMQGDEDGFKAFFREFSAAVRKHDRATLELMMSPTIKFPVEITSPSMAFDYLGYNDGEGWKELEESIKAGTKPYKGSSPQAVNRVTQDNSVLFGRGSDGKWRWLRFGIPSLF